LKVVLTSYELEDGPGTVTLEINAAPELGGAVNPVLPPDALPFTNQLVVLMDEDGNVSEK
jgi:hypothetical protein